MVFVGVLRGRRAWRWGRYRQDWGATARLICVPEPRMIFLPSALNRVAIDGPADPLTPSPEAVPEALTAENMTGKGRFTQSKNNERAP